jgi:membrane protein YdbS with pleckstrin-like domain
VDHIEALERLARLKDSGVLTDAEFNAQKAELLKRGFAGEASATVTPSSNSSVAADEETVEDFRGSTRGWLFGSFAGWASLLLCLLYGLGLVIIFFKWLANISSRYELTTQRLLIRTGILMKRVDEIELFRVKDVRVDFSLLNQLTDIGTITLRTSDVTSGGREFAMREVPRAREIRETIRSLVDDARQRRGVREIDFDHRFV